MLAKFIINPPVFFGSIIIIGLFLAVGVIVPDQAAEIFAALQTSILLNFGWFYLLVVGIFLASVLLLSLGRYGRLKLGPDDSTPDFSFMSWIAMLFAAGMGIGLMYYAVGEPVSHFMAPPTAEPRSIEATRQAMAVTFFHWGIHAWAIYAVVGLSLAYFGYRYNLPLTIRSGLYPLLKERINGPVGHAVDIFAIVGTMFGIATSLGLGVSQINAGLNYLTGVPIGLEVQLPLILVITGLATISVVTGLDKGVRILSEVNLLIAILLMLFVLVVGPTAQLFRDFVQNIGLYLDSLVLRTFNIYAYQPTPWIDDWTLFYWAWWISWSPFVGMFIARISRGRTVREFVTAVLFIPAGFTFFWMTVFGNSAILIDTTIANGKLGAEIAADVSVGLFHFFEYLPWTTLTSTLAVLLVAIFFITSSDSGSLVVDSIAAGGETETTTAQRVFWCALEGIVAASLLVAGGLGALQSVTIASALPFSIVILVLVWSLFKGMRADLAQQVAHAGIPNAPTAQPAAGLTWQRRLGLMLHAPSEREVLTFVEGPAMKALSEVASELNNRGRDTVVVSEDNGSIALRSSAEGVRDFIYGIMPASHQIPAFSTMAVGKPEFRFEARTYFSSGGRGYDVMGMTKEQLISDVLVQFERYLALVHTPETQLVHSAPEHSADM
ncbi:MULTISPECIES: BCCT family transporter [Brucella]|uniref:BCCT family transporter n=2 Tax=Brucella pseudogrignonensis TaxID=419475 RepID=A0A7Y3T8Z0_9HYPH|nr:MULTISPECIES: BCCT family transporter [Brucella]MQP40514.1 BCCT family transporter [Ochrobactrum sp. MYb237]ANG99145.1 transporter [Brucella pseudogrignonensis]NNV23182.1 BCCT family transporter [Brucella pseudogrignonensis]PQZ38904.1 BCCT family transporter [Brucella pseudogrignonensis]PRA40912.1 BCCT family transporter [Brucella pseudogrignonensis]